jgi:ketose-bisphosphate aldolase
MLVPFTPLLDDARKGGYGVGTFTALNMETARGIIEAAERCRAPLALSITRRMTPYLDLEGLAAYIVWRAERSDVPLCLHLDHGTDLALVDRCLRAGFTSVQYDGPGLAPADRVATTKEAVAMARSYGASIEAELGHIGRVGYEESGELTTAQDAASFVAATGVDILAIAIGSTHGQSPGTAQLDIPRLREISAATPVHLALHGGTGVPSDQVVAAIEAGITKVSYFHGMARAAAERLLDELPDTPHGMLTTLLDGCLRETYGAECARMIGVYGTPTAAPEPSVESQV